MSAGLKDSDLLYVSNENGTVNVYKYADRTLVGALTDFRWPVGECTDKAGDVYITDWVANKIVEYAHGGTTPIYTIRDQFAPYGCSVNPVNGNLAVANEGNFYNPYRPGNLFVYAHARGKPTKYQGSDEDSFLGCAYDRRGDLLAATSFGISEPVYTHFYYLPKLGKSIELLDMPGPSNGYEWGGVQSVAWDGKYWVVDAGDLYRFTINIKAQLIDKIALSGGYASEISIYRKGPKSPSSQVVGASGTDRKSAVFYWTYPAGGNPIDTITKGLDTPSGVAVSLMTGT